MGKRWFLVGVMLLLASLLVVGCGVPQQEHDAVVAERDTLKAEQDAAQTQVESLESNLAKTQSEVESLESDLAKAQSQVGSLQSSVAAAETKYNTFKSDLNTLWTSLNNRLAIQREIVTFYNGAAKVELGEMSGAEYMAWLGLFLMGMGTKVDAVGDPELSQLWEDVFVYGGLGDEAKLGASLVAFTDVIWDLIEEDIQAIEAKLSK